MVPTASTQRLTLLMHTCKIRTEDFLDVATSARLSVVVPTCFHVPVRAIGYYCYGHFCYESGLTGNSKIDGPAQHPSQYATRLLCGSTMHTCITMYVGHRRSARSYCVRAHAPGLEQTDDYHRRPCKLCVNWMPEYSDCRSPYSDMHMGPITGLALPLMLGSTAILICITSADYVKA